MAAAIDFQDLQRTAGEFEQAFTPPGWIYNDAALFERERRELFSREWLCTGHVSRIANPGDFFVVDCAGESVIIGADQDGRPHAFYNVCRHRGTRMVNERNGNCRAYKCPYHAWAYGLDGTLIAAPTMDDVEGFRKADYPLRDVRMEVWNGFVFVCLDPDTPPMSEVYSDFPDLSHLDLASVVRLGYHDYTVDANWKLISENYNECYHCALAHPQLHRVSADRDFPDYKHHSGRHFTGGPMSIRPDFNTLTISGKTPRAPLPGWPEAESDMVFYFNLYPNMFLSLAPDYVLTHYLWPVSPDKVYIETEWFFAPEQIAADNFNPDDAIEFWDTTNRQDWDLCENAHKGLRSQGHRPGRYQSWESSVHDFDRWYVGRMFANEIG